MLVYHCTENYVIFITCEFREWERLCLGVCGVIDPKKDLRDIDPVVCTPELALDS